MKAIQQSSMKQGAMTLYQALREEFLKKLLAKSLDNGFVKITTKKMRERYDILKENSLFPLEANFWDVCDPLEKYGFIERRECEPGHFSFRPLLD